MTEGERRRAFAEAFIAQARSDWRAHRVLAGRQDIATCHGLHYLQMVCEKLAKAYRLRDTRSPVDELVSKHSGFAKFIGPFFMVVLKDEYRGKDAQLRGLIVRARTLGREIEKLAPAIDRTAVPENAEYPWERDDRVIAPCQHDFPSLELLRQPGGRAFLNLVERALDGFESLSLGGEAVFPFVSPWRDGSQRPGPFQSHLIAAASSEALGGHPVVRNPAICTGRKVELQAPRNS